MAEATTARAQTGLEAVQARFWNTLRAAPVASQAHHTVVSVHCDGPVDVVALERALADLTQSHPALGCRPNSARAILEPAGLPVPVRRVEATDERAGAALLDEHAADGIDLDRGPLLAVTVVALPGRTVIGVVGHRLACDPASLPGLVEQLAGHYDAHRAGCGAPQAGLVVVPPPRTPDDAPITDPAADELYKTVRKVPLDVELPGMLPRSGSSAHGVAHHRVDIDLELAREVTDTAARLGVTGETLHLACFRALLHRLARQDSVLVMSDLVRGRPGGSLGCWTDLVPLALEGARKLTGAALVATTRRQLDQALARRPVSVPALAQRMQQDNARSGSTLGRVAFSTRPPVQTLRVDGGTWQVRGGEPPHAEFDLMLTVYAHEAPGDAGRTLSFAYDPAVFTDWAVPTIARSYVRMLRALVERPDAVVADLEIVDRHDRTVLLTEWNGPADLVPVARPIPREFEAQVAERPDATAVHDRGTAYTYGEVDAWANRVAHALLDGGVRKADVVGIYLRRSVEWVVAQLAAYKVGAVTVALDPSAPRSRLDAAVAVSPPVALLAAADAPVAGAGLAISVVEVDGASVCTMPAEVPDVHVGLDDLAYVVQTSGSTGRPRAVFGSHRAHAHLAVQVAEVMGIRPGSRVSWLVDAAAGISISLVWRPLCAGAALHIASDEELGSAVRLRRWHLEHGLTHTFVTTQLAEPLTAMEWPDDGPLTVMEVGGEKVRRWPPAELPFEVVVAYGSNEAFLVTSMLFPWKQRMSARTATAADRRRPPPVGRPLPGVEVYVVDADGRLLPPGAVGEVCVATPELMLGYLGEPAETARRVRPNPFGRPGSRLFRTGDVGSMRPDGMLELAGRLDDMIKVRGFRVEPAMVEAILLDHFAVTAAAVVPVADDAGHNQLVACVVADPPVEPEQLRAFMVERAPAYMVPIAYPPMDRLPTGVLNKVDRKQLPPEGWSAHRARAVYRAPSGADEEILTRIWGDVLGGADLGVDDNLVEMGASSLHVGQVQVRILEQLGVELSMREIFEAPTPAAVALAVRRHNAKRRTPLPPVRTRRTRVATSR